MILKDVFSKLIALGTWGYGGYGWVNEHLVGWDPVDDKELIKTLSTCRDYGIVHIDTADVYGNGYAEWVIGEALKNVPRDSFFIASKVGYEYGGYGRPYHPELIRRRLQRSLKLLRVDYLDLYYFHHASFGDKDQYLDDALDTFYRLRDEGLIRYIGLSDWSVRKVSRVVERISPDVVQILRNVLDDRYKGSSLEKWVTTNNRYVVFFSPLKHGLLTGKYISDKYFSTRDFRTRVKLFSNSLFLSDLQNVIKKVRDRFGDNIWPFVSVLVSDTDNSQVVVGIRNSKHLATFKNMRLLTLEEINFIKREIASLTKKHLA